MAFENQPCTFKLLGLWWTSGPVQQGRISRKPRERFGPVKPFFSSSASKNGEVHASKSPCMKRTSLNIKNLRVKQLCIRKVRFFATAFRVRKRLLGFQKTGPRAKYLATKSEHAHYVSFKCLMHLSTLNRSGGERQTEGKMQTAE